MEAIEAAEDGGGSSRPCSETERSMVLTGDAGFNS